MSASASCGHSVAKAYRRFVPDIVAKVPDRSELIFLLLKNSTDDRDSCAFNRVTEIVSQFIVRR
jgi:hypothetical protein